MIARMKRRRSREDSDPADTAQNVLRLSRLLTREREELPLRYLEDPGLRRAYLHYYLPANIRKVLTPLQELALHPRALPLDERLRVLDIGSGPGTALLGVLEFLADRPDGPQVELTAVDHVPANLAAADRLVRQRAEELGISASLRTVRTDAKDLLRAVSGAFDLVILSNLLNELFTGDPEPADRRAALLAGIRDRLLDPAGSCIVIEPALRSTSRGLLEVRDRLLRQGFGVYAPCLCQTPCPALARTKDWCHEERPWSPPPRVQEVDQLTGLRKDALKFSYLVLRRDRLALSDIAGSGALRVVSEPLVSKGKIELFCCGPAGRCRVVRLDRDRTASNALFERLRRGDIIRLEGPREEGERIRVAAGTKVLPVLLPRGEGEAS